MTEPKAPEIIVIGAGIIGVSSALALLRAGHRVRLLDRTGVAAETSSGNAGAFAFTEIEPLATPGIMRKAPKWLLDPLGPLAIRPAYAARIAPWMLRFWRASWPDRYEGGVKAQSSLMTLSRAALERLLPTVDGETRIRREGQLQLFESQSEFEASLPSWEARRQQGIRFDLIEGQQAIAEIQPGLNPRFTHAGFTPDWINVVDPAQWTRHLGHQFVTEGGILDTADVHALTPGESWVDVVTSTGSLRAGQVVVAAGAWSHHLARGLGDKIPLETERGYNTTFASCDFDLRTHVTFSRHGFVVSKIGEGVRIGGAVELGGLQLPPNYKRAEILLRKAKSFLTGFDPEGGTQWMGFRPSLPDSLPVIGRSPTAERVIYAFGHGHLGLTQSAGTAELVAALAAGRTPEISLAPFAPQRF